MNNINTDLLPGIISSIVSQKHNRNRYSIFVEQEFLIGISESVLTEFNLSKGVEMTPLLFEKVRQSEYRSEVKSYLMQLLARRDHSRKELLEKALKKGYPEDIIIQIEDELEQKGYLDDASFAKKFASDKANLNNWGPAKIRSSLLRKGIPNQVIEHALTDAFAEIDLRPLFLDLVDKRGYHFRKEEDLYKRKKKIFDYLRRKGYKSEQILHYLGELEDSLSK